MLRLTNTEYQRLERMKFKNTQNIRRLSDRYVAKIIVLKERGFSYKSIMDELGVSNTSVRKYYFDYKEGRIQDNKILEIVNYYRELPDFKVIKW
jgi:hypothetical protein